MELFIDTADAQAVAELSEVLTIAGATTNPTIITRSGKTPAQVLDEMSAVLAPDQKLFMQVIASDPISARREDIPEETIEHEREIYRAQAADSGRPEKFWDGIVYGRLKKFFQERALTEQAFVKDGNVTVGELAANISKEVGDVVEVNTPGGVKAYEILKVEWK
jgi:translation elongation factor EF-Ts